MDVAELFMIIVLFRELLGDGCLGLTPWLFRKVTFWFEEARTIPPSVPSAFKRF